jgi:hypothetical protein
MTEGNSVVGEIARWVFYSPRRLFVTLAGVVVVIGVVATALTLDKSAAPAAPSGQAQPSVAGLPALQPYIDTAVAFTNVWAHREPNESTDEWIARLTPHATPELVSALRTTDPANLPDTRVEGAPRARYVSEFSALLAVPLANGESVAVTVISDSGTWQVSDVQPNTGDFGAAS